MRCQDKSSRTVWCVWVYECVCAPPPTLPDPADVHEKCKKNSIIILATKLKAESVCEIRRSHMGNYTVRKGVCV